MQKYKSLRKAAALLMSLLIVFGSCITAFSATDFTQQTGTKVYLDSTGASIDQLNEVKATKITLTTDSSYGLTSGTGNNTTINFTNQIDGSSGTLFHNGGNMTVDKAKYSDGSSKYVWCIRPSAKYGSYSDLEVSSSNKDATDYYKALNKDSNSALKEAIGKTIAYGSYLISNSKSDNNKAKYYFATQLILWEFIAGSRSTNYSNYKFKNKDKCSNNYAYKEGKYHFINYISGTHKSDVSDGMSDILYAMRRTTLIPQDFYRNLDSAISNKDDKDNRITMIYSEKNKNFTESKKFPGIKYIKETNDLTFSVVNQNDNSGSTAESVKISVSGNKVTLSTTEDLSSKSNTYYLKVTKSKDYTEAKNDIVYDDTSSQSKQTLANKIKYEEDVLGYYPITTDITPIPTTTTQPTTTAAPTGSFQIKKTITTNSPNNLEEDSYENWVFSVEAVSAAGKKIGTYLVFTDEDGITPAIEDLPIGTVCTVKELGKNITDLLEENTKDELIDEGYKNITEVNSTLVCAFPPHFYVNNEEETKTVTEADVEANNVTTVSFTNQCYFPVKLHINKSCTDNDSPEGYYFIIYTEGISSGITTMTPKLVGPTDEEGNIEITINRPYTSEAFGCIELGKAIDPEKLENDWSTVANLGSATKFIENWYTIRDLMKQYFYIPDKYKQPSNGARQIYEAFPFTFSYRDLELGEKDFYIVNEAFGKIKIIKTDDINNKPMAGINFEVYAPKNASDFTQYLEDKEKGLNPELPETSELDTLVETLTTDDNGEALTKSLPVGVYYLKEDKTSCPGYAEPIEDILVVNLTSDTNTEENPNILEFPIVNKLSKLTVNKLGVTSTNEEGAPLSGAVMQIFETPASGTIDYTTAVPIKEFTTTDSSYKLNGVLEIGKSYTLHEKSAPTGYNKSEDIVFTLENGNEKIINVKDISTKVKVIKIDNKTNENMSGVRLQIQDEQGNPVKVKDYDGNLVESWLTQTTPLLIEETLEAGKKYQLAEIETLPGYALAKPVSFEVSTEGELQSVTMYNDTTKYKFSKKDITGTDEIPDCHITLKEKGSTTNLREWITTNEPYYLEGVLEIGKTYVMTETKPADGYATAQSIEFTVQNDGIIHTITMNDDTTKVEFSKTTLTGTEELAGAHLEVTDKDGNVIDSWVSGEEPHLIEGVLVAGETYTLVETKPADGYATADSIEFTVEDTSETQTVQMKDDTTKVEFSKTTLTGTDELAGAHLEVVDKDGNVIDSWVSGEEPHLIEGVLVAGETYTMVETQPVDGYTTADSIEFTVEDTSETQTVQMKDGTTRVEFSKTTLTGTDELAGAHLEVTDKDGNVIDSWVSGEEPHLIEGVLVAGETYTLVETQPADGYTTAQSIDFTVEDTSETQTVQMKDDTTKVEFSKTTLTGTDELAGAHLEVTDKDGNVIDSWVSGEKPHLIEGVLVAGETYTLVETQPADGYTTAQSIEFTVEDTSEIQTIQMKDGTTRVEFSKTTLTGTDELAGAHLEVTDKDGNVIDSWVSGDEPHLIEGVLVAGETYTMVETQPADGYATADSIEFTVEDTSETQTVQMKDDTTKVEFSKTTLTGTDELAGAHLEVVDKDGNVIDSWVSGEEPHLIEGILVAGETYTLVETQPADGYATADSIEFTVEDTSEIQTVQMKDDTTKVEFLKIAEDTGKNLKNAKLKLEDSNGKTVDTWTTNGEAHYIQGSLAAGETYCLKEVSAPNGYLKADDIEFTVEDTSETQTIKMIDKAEEPVYPKTGGFTNNAFYIALGITLMLGGVFVFASIKRKKSR